MRFPFCECVAGDDDDDVMMMELIGVAMGQGVEIGAELVLLSR